VEMEVQNGTILIRAPQRPRAGWADAFERMARYGDDTLLDSESTSTSWDDEEWQWK